MTHQLDSDVELLVAGLNPMITLQGLEHQARSKPEFLQHVREFVGVRRLLKNVEQKVSLARRRSSDNTPFTMKAGTGNPTVKSRSGN